MRQILQRTLLALTLTIAAACTTQTPVTSIPTRIPNSSIPTQSPIEVANTPTPQPTSLPPIDSEEQVSLLARIQGPPALTAGAGHTCMLTNTGRVLCWGANQFGQLGNGNNPLIYLENAPIAEGETLDHWALAWVNGVNKKVRAISAGAYHTCALTGSGEVQCWGWNAYGQLGDGTTKDSATPVMVEGLSGVVQSISSGATHTCAVLLDGGVQCWGQNENGQLGDGTDEDRRTPVWVKDIPDSIVQIVAGTPFTCALSSDAKVYCWGSGAEGRFGDGSQSSYRTAVELTELSGSVSMLTAGQYHLCAAMNTDEVWCWGALSSEEQFSPDHPLAVRELQDGVAEIVAGGGFTCALLQGGSVKCWGDNYFGQLGNRSDMGSWEPVDVAGLESSAVGIASGSVHACALMSDSGVYCWGDPSMGQLGDRAITWNWDTYTSTRYGFSIAYPAEWQVLEIPNPDHISEIDQVWFAIAEFPPPGTDAQPDVAVAITAIDPSSNWQSQYFDDYKSENINLGSIPGTKISGVNKESGYEEIAVIAKLGEYYLQIMPVQSPDPQLFFNRIISTVRLNGYEFGKAEVPGFGFKYNLLLGDIVSAQSFPEYIEPSGFMFNDRPRHIRFDISQPYTYLAPFAHLRSTGTPWQLYENPLTPDMRPQIFVFDAEDFTALNQPAADRIDNLRSLISGQVITSTNELPLLPLFNSTQDIRGKIQPLKFEGGGGIRFIARYAQDAVPVKNPQIFYTFQGLTDGDEYYIAAFFPLYVPILPDRMEVEDWDEFNEGYRSYLINIMGELERLGYDDFYPNIAMLDTLIESMVANPMEILR